jgi:prophage regulatory protein
MAPESRRRADPWGHAFRLSPVQCGRKRAHRCERCVTCADCFHGSRAGDEWRGQNLHDPLIVSGSLECGISSPMWPTQLHRPSLPKKESRNVAPAFYRLRDVVRISALSRSTIYRRIAEGTFPRQVRLGPRASAWSAKDLQDWIDDPEGYRVSRQHQRAPASQMRCVRGGLLRK